MMSNEMRAVVRKKVEIRSPQLKANNGSQKISSLDEAKNYLEELVKQLQELCEPAQIVAPVELVELSRKFSESYVEWPQWRHANSQALKNVQFPAISIKYIEKIFRQILFDNNNSQIDENLFKILSNLLKSLADYSKTSKTFSKNCVENSLTDVLMSYLLRFATVEWSSNWDETIRIRYCSIATKCLYILSVNSTDHRLQSFHREYETLLKSLPSINDADIKFQGFLLAITMNEEHFINIDSKYLELDMLRLMADRLAAFVESKDFQMISWVIDGLEMLTHKKPKEAKPLLSMIDSLLRPQLLRTVDELYLDITIKTLSNARKLIKFLDGAEATPVSMDLEAMLNALVVAPDKHTVDISLLLSAIKNKNSLLPYDSEEVKQKVASLHVSTGFLAVLCNLTKDLMGRDFVQHLFYFATVRIAMEMLFLLSDLSEEIRQVVALSGLIEVLVNELADSKGFQAKMAMSAMYDGEFIDSLLCVLYNTSRSPSHRYVFQDVKAADVLALHVHRSPTLVSLCIAYCISDSPEAAQMADNRGILKNLLEIVESGLDYNSKLIRSEFGYFSLEELLDGLCLLATNDANKLKLESLGAIDLIKRLLCPDKREMQVKETLRAIDLLWTLTFEPSIRAKLVENHQNAVIEPLRELCKNQNSEIRNSAHKTLTFIEKFADSRTVKAATSQSNTGHIFLSYSWKQQETVLKLRDALIANGFEVWMDVDKMKGGLLEAMASAVEQASVVVICFSQSYKESNPCRAEAQYAFSLGKPIIPLNMEYRYRADGWLGILVRPLKYIDLSLKKRTFEWALGELLKIFPDLIKQTQTHETATISHQNHGTSAEPKTDNQSFVKWSSEKFSEWLESEGVDQTIVSKFTAVDGKLLGALNRMRTRAPESYYSTLKQFCVVDESLAQFLTMVDALDRFYDASP